MSTTNRVAVVTGGGSGIGQAIAADLARNGRQVAVLDLNGEAAEKVVSELQADGASAIAVQLDVSDPDAVTQAFKTVRDTFGPTEILVTSAAIAGFTRFDKITFEESNRYLAVNLTGTFLCLQAALSDMAVAKSGRIVTISSAAGQQGAVGQGHARPPRVASSHSPKRWPRSTDRGESPSIPCRRSSSIHRCCASSNSPRAAAI